MDTNLNIAQTSQGANRAQVQHSALPSEGHQITSPGKKGVKSHKKHHAKSSNKKKGRGSQSDSSMRNDDDDETLKKKGGHDDEDMEDEEEEQDSDEEDYDDEDDEDNSFIAPDEDVFQELQEEQERKRKERPEGQKKKKKKRSDPQLDEDDLDLIKSNTGIEIPTKKKRLQKQSEKEKMDMEEDGQEEGQYKEDPDEQLFEEKKGGESDEEMIDTQRKRVVRPGRKHNDGSSFNQVDQERLLVARSIFDNKQALEDRIKTIPQPTDKGDLEEMYDGAEIDDQFATQLDKEIAATDIPERLQLYLLNRFNPTPEELIEEAEWIFHRLLSDNNKDSLSRAKKIVCEKIAAVVSLFRKDKSDIPYIVKYRRYVYIKELSEADVWNIFNLDIEYGKFKQQMTQIDKYLKTFSMIDKDLVDMERSELQYCQSTQKLSNYSPFINFLKSYFQQELLALENTDIKIKPQIKADRIQMFKKHKIDEAVRQCMLKPSHFIQNLQNQKFINRPSIRNEITPAQLAMNYKSSFYQEPLEIIEAICKFASIELGCQPYIRKIMKEHFYQQGYIQTSPTEQGQKELDVLHPSYHIKRIDKEPISNFLSDERFIEILQHQKANNITLEIGLEKRSVDEFLLNLQNFYIPAEYESQDQWRYIMIQVLKMLIESILIPEITSEIKQELYQSSEDVVIKLSKEKYKNLVMTGPFSCDELKVIGDDHKEKKIDDDIIKDRPRCNVMGVILHSIENNNKIATVAVVDKYGEVVANLDLMNLMPPRKLNPRFANPVQGQDEEDQRAKKAAQDHQQEEDIHSQDKKKVRDLLYKHSVDLIVLGANKLEARMLKKVLQNIAEDLKSFGIQEDQEKSNSKKQEEPITEAFVIWGSLEVPKLFANSHQSQKLLKNYHLVLKQAICLARYEQDPLNEYLNLWNFVPSENQTLQLNLHPLQKKINQAKLAEHLEEVNVQCVNAIGIDLNLVIHHDHMHNQMSFLSGIGPRKAKKFIQLIKSKGNQVMSRGEIYKESYIGSKTFISTCGFLKIRIIQTEGSKQEQLPDILDQTRIHQESYQLAAKVAKDVIHDQGSDLSTQQAYLAVRQVIKDPWRIQELDFNSYKEELEKTRKGNMTVLLDLIVEEFEKPFADPRVYRTPTRLQMTPSQLFYLLIDESERTFKRGVVVTATVSRVLEKIVLVKLDNGLDGVIRKDGLDNSEDNLSDLLDKENVVTGRIHEIQDQEEGKFGVVLNCKKQDLHNHQKYIPEGVNIDESDYVNQNFQLDPSKKQVGKFKSRRINHPKFKNVTCSKAIAELNDKEVGDFIFRPSSKGPNNITLTWKFYSNNMVHIDIEEREKPVGANIGNKLLISDQVYDSLQEIVDTYITRCNRHMRDACSHIKFIPCKNTEELESILKEEKIQDSSRIPYKITCLPDYPQYLVIGYIPKKELVKEYIKVKPQGYQFHDKYHQPIQMLFNWFKENFKDREYLRRLKRARSPRARVIEQPERNQNRNSGQSQNNQWGNVGQEWQPSGANSVHSMNDDNNYSRQRPAQDNYGSVQNQDSAYNQNQHMNSGGDRRVVTCFNCQQTGHMSRECPNPKQERGYGRGRGGDDRPQYDRDNNDGRGSQQKSFGRGQRQQETSSGAQVSNGWGNDKPKSPYGGNDTVETDQWGNNVTANEPPQVSRGWGDNNDNDQIGQPSGGDGWGNGHDQGRASPARSQMSEGRGQRRGRGGFGGNNNGGGSRACFKCNEEGHMARECPNQDSRDGGDRGRGRGRGSGGNTCFKCQQEGHMARECPNPDSREGGRGRGRGSGGNTCFKCQQEGHMARECPNPDSRDGDRGRGRGRSRGRGDYDRDRDNGDNGPYKRQRRDDGGSSRRQGSDYGNSGNNWANPVDNDRDGWAGEQFPQSSGQEVAWNQNQRGTDWSQEPVAKHQEEEKPWGEQ